MAMTAHPPLPPGDEALVHLRRLVLARWLVIALMTLLVAATPHLLDITLPQAPLFAVLAVTALYNGVVHRRMRHATQASPAELFGQLLIDLAALSALVFFAGGATNPLVSLLLPPVAIAALTLPARHVAAITAGAVLAYSLLMRHYLPLSIGDARRATQLHLTGMWLTFVVSAALIGWLIVRNMRLLRTRDAELATAREQALRDERVLAMGTLAAGAAHELGTPLATMALIAGELENDAALPAAVREDVALLRRQIGTCKEIISGLARRAGTEHMENLPCQPVDRWLEALRQRWHAVRPQASSTLRAQGPGTPPCLRIDPRLEQAVLNLLNNAANANPSAIGIELDWDAIHLHIAIRDRGPGFPPAVLSQGGASSFPAHAGGSGIGLLLTRSAIEQLGGRLALSNPDTGGALARIELPLAKP